MCSHSLLTRPPGTHGVGAGLLHTLHRSDFAAQTVMLVSTRLPKLHPFRVFQHPGETLDHGEPGHTGDINVTQIFELEKQGREHVPADPVWLDPRERQWGGTRR